MQPRLTYRQLNEFAPGIQKSLRELGASIEGSGLEPALVELVKIRASQINGCAFCLNMHLAEARKKGESEERVILLDAWRETPLYSDRERAALAWTEALTLITQGHVPDAVYDEARRHFSDKELANLTSVVIAINSWNRVMIAYLIPPTLGPAKPS